MYEYFGNMCPYRTTLCQERSGCGNCQIYRNHGKIVPHHGFPVFLSDYMEFWQEGGKNASQQFKNL